MTDMAIGEKYAPLGNWLKEHGGDSVKLTFDELNQIIPIPTTHIRTDHPGQISQALHPFAPAGSTRDMSWISLV